MALKNIHDTEAAIENRVEWNRLSDVIMNKRISCIFVLQEDRRMRTETLELAKMHVRSWLILGRDTMDLFCCLTVDAPEPFNSEVSLEICPFDFIVVGIW